MRARGASRLADGITISRTSKPQVLPCIPSLQRAVAGVFPQLTHWRIQTMPVSGYDPVLSNLLVQACELTYVQYKNGPPPGNNGNIKAPAGYTQIASFTAPEIDLSKLKLLSLSAQAGPLTPLV